MTDPDLMAKLRVVAGPSLNDLQLEILVDLVRSHDGRKGGRPPKPKEHQIDVSETGFVTGSANLIDGGFGGSFSGSAPLPDPVSLIAKPRRRYNSMSVPEGFTEFWHLYPRRVCKLAAIKAWERINPDINLRASILASLKWQIDQVFSRREIEKVPHPATWLNGRRWDDERPKTNGAHDPYQRLG
jgi:hypothetical protein